jgi:hypothetical protein
MNSWQADLVLSFLGSSLFWITMAAFAIRRLWIDERRFENWLKAKYHEIDTLKIDYWRWIQAASKTTFVAIYGRGEKKRFVIIVTSAAIAMNLFGLRVLYRDWEQRKNELESILRDSYEVEPQYATFISTPEGSAEIDKAFETTLITYTVPTGTGQETRVAEVYKYKDERSTEIRRIVNSYEDQLPWYAAKHHVRYEINLIRLFGVHDSSSEVGLGLVSLILLALIITIPSALINAGAASLILRFAALTSGSLQREMLVEIVYKLIAYFSLSIIHYSNVLAGNIWGSWFLLLTILGVLLWGGFSLGFISQTEEGPGLFRFLMRLLRLWIIIAYTIIILGTIANYGVLSGERTITDGLKHIMTGLWLIVMAVADLRPLTFLLSCTSIFPVFLLTSIIATVSVLTVLFYSIKEVVLSEIYGVVVIAGGTYIAGFLTLIMQCTTFVFFLLQILL